MDNIGFAMTLGALKELLTRCPDGDISNIMSLFTGNTAELFDNMAWFIVVLNRWYQYRETRSFDGAVTEDDILALNINELNALFDKAMAAFKTGNTPETEVTPTKK